MKKIFFLLGIFLLTLNCAPQQTGPKDGKTVALKPEKNDDGEWDLEVLDPQWNYFLNAVAKPMGMYTESYLKTKNNFLVSEWNSYYYARKFPNIIENPIDYDSQENYGLKFEYKLYQVFAFVQWRYGLKMNNLSMGEVR